MPPRKNCFLSILKLQSDEQIRGPGMQNNHVAKPIEISDEFGSVSLVSQSDMRWPKRATSIVVRVEREERRQKKTAAERGRTRRKTEEKAGERIR